MPDECRICGRTLPPRSGRRGRAPLYCSAACRQVAYRNRQIPTDEAVREQLAEVAGRIERLEPRSPEAFLADVAELAASVRRLRRLARARLARGAAPDEHQ